MITGICKVSAWFALAGAFTLVLGAIYMLYAYQQTMLGPLHPALVNAGDVGLMERIVLIPLIFLILLFGIWPQPVLDLVKTIPDLLPMSVLP